MRKGVVAIDFINLTTHPANVYGAKVTNLRLIQCTFHKLYFLCKVI